MTRREYFTIPNLLSISRVVFLPLLFLFLANGQTVAFVTGYIILGLTDAFDGWIARKFNLQSELGMYLDTYADLFYYLSSAYFLYKVAPEVIEPNLMYLFYTLALLGVVMIISILKFKKLLLLHTIILKANGIFVYLLIIFSVFMNTTLFVTFIITLYVIGFMEEAIIFIKIGEVDGDTKSIFTAKPISNE